MLRVFNLELGTWNLELPTMEIETTLQLLAEDPTTPLDVAEVGLLLAVDEYPDLDVAAYLRLLDRLALEVRPHLIGGLEDRVMGLSQFLFEQQGYQGNSSLYYDPRNSYFSDVLDRKLGIPITLTALAMTVAHRAGLDVVGIGLPGHFIAKAIAGDEEVLFDPFHGGQILTHEGCQSLVEAVTGETRPLTRAMLQATPPGWIVMRMLNNLKGIYLRNEDYSRAIRVVSRLRLLAPNDPSFRRDLGVALMRSGQPGQAIDHLSAYLEANPSAVDETLVRQVIAKARDEVAKWN